MTDARRFSPPAQRNREPIAVVLSRVLPHSGSVLTIAEGTGEHCVHFAKAFPNLTFQPTDPDPDARASIAAWTALEGLQNVLPPAALDVRVEDWPDETAATSKRNSGPREDAAPKTHHFDAMVCINMIHISPWAATEGLMRGAARVLTKGGPLYLYGPYRRDGKQTAESNEKFEGWLKSLSPDYGVRDLADVAECAARNGFTTPEITEMPANNFSVVFRRG